MDAEDARHARLNRLIHRRNAALDDREIVADECRQQAGGPEAPMRSGNRDDGFNRGIVVEQSPAAAIDLNVDESRQQQLTVKIDQLRTGRRR